MAYPLAVLATCVASANAFMATGPVLRASPAPAISRAKLGSVRMTAAAPTEVLLFPRLAIRAIHAIARPCMPLCYARAHLRPPPRVCACAPAKKKGGGNYAVFYFSAKRFFFV